MLRVKKDIKSFDINKIKPRKPLPQSFNSFQPTDYVQPSLTSVDYLNMSRIQLNGIALKYFINNLRDDYFEFQPKPLMLSQKIISDKSCSIIREFIFSSLFTSPESYLFNLRSIIHSFDEIISKHNNNHELLFSKKELHLISDNSYVRGLSNDYALKVSLYSLNRYQSTQFNLRKVPNLTTNLRVIFNYFVINYPYILLNRCNLTRFLLKVYVMMYYKHVEFKDQRLEILVNNMYRIFTSFNQKQHFNLAEFSNVSIISNAKCLSEFFLSSNPNINPYLVVFSEFINLPIDSILHMLISHAPTEIINLNNDKTLKHDLMCKISDAQISYSTIDALMGKKLFYIFTSLDEDHFDFPIIIFSKTLQFQIFRYLSSLDSKVKEFVFSIPGYKFSITKIKSFPEPFNTFKSSSYMLYDLSSQTSPFHSKLSVDSIHMNYQNVKIKDFDCSEYVYIFEHLIQNIKFQIENPKVIDNKKSNRETHYSINSSPILLSRTNSETTIDCSEKDEDYAALEPNSFSNTISYDFFNDRDDALTNTSDEDFDISNSHNQLSNLNFNSL